MNAGSFVFVGALLGMGAAPLLAQMPATPPHDSATAAQKTPLAAQKPENANAPAKDGTAAKPAPKKAAAKKPAAKAPAKEARKKAPPKKDDADAKAAKKPANTTMQLRDEKGNVIPMTPDAYDVSSALPAKPRK